MAKVKAHKLNGFPPLFFRQHWTIVWDEVVEVIQQFFATTSIPIAYMMTFITLLLKRHDALKLDYFRPINLYSTLYKVCTKS